MLTNDHYRDLSTKSFCVLRNFLPKSSVDLISQDFDLIKEEKFINPNFNIFPVGKKKDLTEDLMIPLENLGNNITEYTSIKTNHTCTPTYFSIKHGINFGYHQDHDSWFLYGDHANYLNVWIPIVKPEKSVTNVTVVDFEKLFKHHPELSFLINYGATRAEGGTNSKIIDDNLDKEYPLDFDLDYFSETPFLEAGDALIMRGDSLHKTQDTLTERLAISARRLNTLSKVHKSHFNITSNFKRQLIETNPGFYQKILDLFKLTDERTVGDLL